MEVSLGKFYVAVTPEGRVLKSHKGAASMYQTAGKARSFLPIHPKLGAVGDVYELDFEAGTIKKV